MIMLGSMLVGFIILALFIIVWPLKGQLHYSKKNISIIVSVIVFLPLASISLYAYWGNSPGLFRYLNQAKQSKTVTKALAKYKQHPDLLIQQFKAQLMQHPNSAKGWYLLGKLYLSMGQFDNAIDALNKSLQLKSDDTTKLSLLEAMALSQKQSYQPTINQLISELLKANPNDPISLNFAALNAYHQHHYAYAVKYWERLLPMLPANSKSRMQVMRLIAKAQKKIL